MTKAERVRQRIAQAVMAYKVNPDRFSDEQVKQLKVLADQAGIPMEIPFSFGRAAGNLLFEAADTALLGLLPNSWKPPALTSGERIAGVLGDIASFAVPFAIGGKIAKAGLGLVEDLAGGSTITGMASDWLSGSESGIADFIRKANPLRSAGKSATSLLDKILSSGRAQSVLQAIAENESTAQKAFLRGIELGAGLTVNKAFENGPNFGLGLIGTGLGVGGAYIPQLLGFLRK